MTLTLPFPPSTNHYWRATEGTKRVLTSKARIFRANVLAAAKEQRVRPYPPTARLAVYVQLHPPDRRRRDIDNFGGKALLDALEFAGIMPDDSQVDSLHVVRGDVVKDGAAIVTIEALPDPTLKGAKS